MIFKRLFQPKHQHKDPAVRIQALQQLNPQEPQQKTILHELAFNDSEASVSLAALGRLNNFDLWWKMASTSRDQRIAKRARTKVEQALLGNNDVVLTQATRRTFILECQDSALLEMLLQERALDEADTALMLSVLEKLNKPQFNLKLLLTTANTALSEKLFSQLTEESDIARVAKKATNVQLAALANQKLHYLEEQKSKPLHISKEVTLVLSKLLALGDANNYEKLVEEKDTLSAQFAQLQQDFACLSDEIRSEFEQKFHDIQQRISRKMDALHHEWAQRQATQAREAAVNQANAFATSVVAEINQVLSRDVTQLTLGELEHCNHQIEQAVVQLDTLLTQDIAEPQRQLIQATIYDLEQRRSSLDDLPALQIALQQAQELQDTFSAARLPEQAADLSQATAELADFTNKWKSIKTPFKGVWPSQVETQWQALRKQWQSAINAIEKQIESDVKKCRDKLNFVSTQIKQGRFHSAMRHYEKLVKQFEGLSESSQARVAKAFEGIRAEVENLRDWQAYIAKPRKPEILAEVEALAKSPLEPEVQAKRVKALRSQWQSLGNLGSDEDQQMNLAFDNWCEEAFKPCRTFYAEQDAQREQNLQRKLALLDELEAANNDDATFASLDKALSRLRKIWKEIGDIDYKSKEVLDARYKAVVEPVKQKVDAFYQDNATLKEAIIAQAETLIGQEDWKQAAQVAKSLQDKWKEIGRVQSKVEKKLWDTFRHINDQVFARRDEAVQVQNADFEARCKALQLEVDALESRVADARSAGDIAALEQTAFVPIDESLGDLPHNLTKAIKAKVRGLKATLASKRQRQLNDKSRQVYRDIFTLLVPNISNAANEQMPVASADDGGQVIVVENGEKSSELAHAWKQAFAGKVTFDHHGFANFNRAELVIIMEITAGVDTPSQDVPLRKDIQLQLMARKLQDGAVLSLDELLQLWISLGELTAQDTALLNRIKVMYLPD